MSVEKYYKIILATVVTEKTSRVMGSNQYAFKVSKDANKKEIKAAVQHLFEVKVDSVRIVNVKAKKKAFSGHYKSRTWKKAYVKLDANSSIPMLSEAA